MHIATVIGYVHEMACLLSSFHAALKLTLVYAALDCVWMLVAYAGFISVVMVTGRGGSCGGPTISYVSVETFLFLAV